MRNVCTTSRSPLMPLEALASPTRARRHPAPAHLRQSPQPYPAAGPQARNAAALEPDACRRSRHLAQRRDQRLCPSRERGLYREPPWLGQLCRRSPGRCPAGPGADAGAGRASALAARRRADPPPQPRQLSGPHRVPSGLARRQGLSLRALAPAHRAAATPLWRRPVRLSRHRRLSAVARGHCGLSRGRPRRALRARSDPGDDRVRRRRSIFSCGC